MTDLTAEFLKAQEPSVIVSILCDQAHGIALNVFLKNEITPASVSEMSRTVAEIERRVREEGLKDIFKPIVTILGDVPGAYLSMQWSCAAAVRLNGEAKSIIINPFADWLDELEKSEPSAP